MFEDMFDDFMEMTSDFYSTWWASPPPPPESFFHYLFGIGFFETVTFLRSTYMGIITLVMLCLLFVSFLMQIMVVCMYLIYWWKEWKQKHSMASLKPAISDSPHSTCHQCHFCKELKNPKMAQTNWKHAIPESTDTEQEVDKDNHMPIQKWRHGFYCMKKKQRNVTKEFVKSEFEESKGLNEKAVNENSFEKPFCDRHGCDCFKNTFIHSFDSIANEKLSYKKSRSVSNNSSQYSALKGGGKDCLALSDSKEKCLKQNLFRKHTSVGTNTSDQFSSEEIWIITPSVTWTSTDGQCTVTSKSLDKQISGSSRRYTALKETEYSSYEYERYSTSPSGFRKDEIIMSKVTLGENAKMAGPRLSIPESSLSYSTQTTKSSYSTETLRKIPYVNVVKLAPYSTLKTQVCNPLTPVSTPGFETISSCSSNGCSSFAHYSDTQWSSETSWSTSTSLNTLTGNTHFSLFETIAEIETSGCMSSTCPSSPTGQTLLASRAIIDKIKRVPVQNDFINNRYCNGLQGTVLPDSNQLPLSDIYHLEEHEKYAMVNNTNFHVYPYIQKVAFLTKENVEKFELLQLRKNLHFVLPPVTEELEIVKRNRGMIGKVRQMENVLYQMIPTVVPKLPENQVRTLELNAAQMALESLWGLPYIQRKSLSMMMPPVSPLPQNSSIELKMKEIKTFSLTENEVYDLEFNLQRRIGMQQWRPISVKAVNSADSANATIMKLEVSTFNERQATRLKLNLERKITQGCRSTPLVQQSVGIQKSPVYALKEDSVEIKTEEVETPLLYYDQVAHLEMRPTTTATEVKVKSFEVIIKEIDTPVSVDSTFIIDNKMRDRLELHITQKNLQHNRDLSSNFQRSTEVFTSSSPKLIPSQLNLIDTYVVTTELPFITVEHKNIIERNEKSRIINNKWGLPRLVQQSLADFMVAARLQSENIDRNYSVSNKTNTPYPFKIIPRQKELPQNGRENMFPSQPERGSRKGKANNLREVSVVTNFKPEDKNKLIMCLTKQYVEINVDCLPNLVMESYKHSYSLASNKHLPKSIRVGKGYKKPRPLYIPFMEHDAVDRLELNLKQKLISTLWGFPTSYEKSLEMIPKAPPVPPPIKTCTAEIEPIGIETVFLEDNVRINLERHITQKKLQLNWGIPTEIQRSRDAFIPPAPTLIYSQLNPQPYLHVVVVLTELAFRSDKHKKMLEINMKKKIINHKRGLLPSVVQKSLINFIDSSLIKDPIAHSDIRKGSKTLSSNTDSHKDILQHTQKLLLRKHNSGENTELNKIESQDKLDICITKQCLEIKMDYLPDIVKEMYKVTYPLESKKSLPKLIALGRRYKKLRPCYMPFIEQDAVDRLELNLKHTQISQFWGLKTLHDKSLEMMISKGLPVPPAIKATDAKIVPIAVKTYFISNEARMILEWHITEKKLQHYWSLPLHIQRSQETFIPFAPKLVASQLNPQPDFDTNIVPIEPAFLAAESKKKLELIVKKRIINHRWGLPKVVYLSLESFMPHAPSVKSIKPQLEISAENEALLNSKFKTVCLQNMFVQLKAGTFSAPQCEEAIKIKKENRKGMLPVIARLKSEHKDQLNMCLTKQSLEIKLDNLSAIVQEFYQNIYPPAPKKTLAKLFAPGEGFKKTRPGYIQFFEQAAIDYLEMNLKNKHISHLWGFQTLHEESMEIMTSKAPPVLPAIKANRGQIEPVPMETAFIGKKARGKLEWHITQKKLQHNWGLPLFYQKSAEEFIPVPPKLVPSQLNTQADFIVVITPCELPFVDVEINKTLELNTRKKIINHRWGLPNSIQSPLRDFMAPAPSMNDIMQSEIMARRKSKANNIEIGENYKTSYPQKTFEQPKREKLSSAKYERGRRKSKTAKLDEIFVFAPLKPEDKNKVDVCLIKQCLEIRMDYFPDMVKEFYKTSYLPESKKSVPKLTVPRNGFKKPRALYIPFIEQDIVAHLELNLKHKQINYLWGLETLHDESMEMMILKGPPVPPAIKVIGAQIEPVGMEINLSDNEVRKDLERHITRKKLQQKWGLPDIQRSQKAFIPAAPKLILSKLNPQPNFVIVFAPTELTFLHEEHKNILEFNLKRTINRKWGLPKLILSSLNNFMAPAPSMKDLVLQTEIIKETNILSNTHSEKENSNVFPEGTFPLHIQGDFLLPQYGRGSNSKISNKVAVFAGLKPEQKNKLEVCLIKQNLEIKMHHLPELVTLLYKNTYPSPLKKLLPRLITPGEGFKKPRLLYIPFIEQNAVDRLELNLKHKQIMHLWILDTLYEMSVEMMIPKGPNMSPVIKSSGVQIEPVGMETAFIEGEARDKLDWHITQKKLENNWGLPLHIQKSIDTFIPSAPKLVLSQLKPHCIYVIVVTSADLAFISAERRKRLEVNTKKKIINQKWELPNLIQSSLRDFMAPPPLLQDHLLQSEIMKDSKTFTNIDIDLNSKMIMKHKKRKLPSLHCQKVYKKANFKISAFPDFANLKPECKDKLNMCLLKLALDIKVHYLPDVVQEYYKNAYPAASRKALPKLTVASEGYKKQRPWCLLFVEQDAIDHLELNLKHRRIIHLWGLETLYDESVEMMIAIGPPVPPAIKASGAKIEPVGMERTFIECDIRDRLEWHITQKKLQQNWGLPLQIQISAETFIPPAPKLIPSQLNPQPSFGVLVAPTELAFPSKEHRKLLELNTKKKIINHKWGLPTLIRSSLRNFMALSLSRKDLVLQPEVKRTNKMGPSNIDIRNKIRIPLQMNKREKLSLQHKKGSKNTKPSKTAEVAVLANFKQEYTDKLDVCLRKLHLEIKMHCLPEMVKEFYKENYPSKSKKPLGKIIAPSEGCKKPRSLCIAFTEQDSVERLELNLKHKMIFCLWGLPTLYEKSVEIMIPKGPPVPPAIKSSVAKIEPVGMETTFIKDGRLEWHITQKKLQHNWGLPLLIQRSQEAFIPPAPKLISSQLKPQPDFVLFFVSPELTFLSSEHRKRLELNTRKRIINYKWGLPKAVQYSLNNFMASLVLQSDVMERNKISSSNIQVRKRKIDTPMNTFLQTKKKMSSKQNRKGSRNLKLNNVGEMCLSAKLKPECKDRLDICLIKLCLEIKICCFPQIVNEMYKAAYPPMPKKPFPKPIEPGKGFKKPRLLYIPFIEQDAVDRLELNLKHKQISHLWGLATLYDESTAQMIPKEPPVPPGIRASGARIEPVGMETTFIDNETKDRLEWHIVQKKLQHNWGFPLCIQRSQETFIPLAPKLIPSQLKPQLSFVIVVAPVELTFLSDGHWKILELNMKKRIINNKWGLPKLIQLSLRSFIPVAPQMNDFLLQPQKRAVPPASNILQMKRGKLPALKYQKSIKAKKNSEVYDNLRVTCGAVVDFCLIKQCLEIKMEYLPKLVMDAYSAIYAQAPKIILPKVILPGKGFKKQRSSYMCFTEQEAVDCLELNLKHKEITHLWGFPTLYEKSLEMMIPKGPPVPPVIKAGGAQIELVDMETAFIKNNTRDRLEWHITQKKLQYNWGLPIHIQRSEAAFIPFAPKLIPSQLKPQPAFSVVIVPTELAFLRDEHKKILEMKTKKKFINCKWGLPKLIQSSLNKFMSTSPDVSSNTNVGNKENKMVPQHTVPTIKRGKLSMLQYEKGGRSKKTKKIDEDFFLASFKPEWKYKLEICLTKLCLEIKTGCLPEMVKEFYKNTYLPISKKPLPKLIVLGKGFKIPRIRYIPFTEQDDIDRTEMNLKHRQLLYLWGLETLYEKSLVMMIPKGPPVPPPIKTSEVQIKPVGGPTTYFCEEVKKLLEWHILQKKLQLTWGLPSHFQKSAEAFIPLAPKLIISQLSPQPDFEIVIAPVELAFINDEHKKALEMNTKKRTVNHIWGLPRLIESSLNEFMVPPPPIKDFIKQFKIKKKKRVTSRTKDITKYYKMVYSQCTSLLNKGQKNTSDFGSFKKSVKMKKRERRTSTVDKFKPECNIRLDMCLMKQSLSSKLDCLPEMVTQLYKQTYPPVLKRPLPKLITPGKGFKRPRLPYILFAEQNSIDRLAMNLKHKQINNLWGIATTFAKSIEMIPKAPSLLPAIKASEAKIEHIGMELAFQYNETIDILEWHITMKRFQHQWGISLHIRRSVDTFIPSPPKLVLSHFSRCPDVDIAVSVNELILLSEEYKEALEINTNNRIINHRQGLPNIIQNSLSSFIPPAPPVCMQLLETGEGSTTGLNRSELSKINTVFPAEQKLLASTTNGKDGKESNSVNSMEELSVSPKLEFKDKVEVDVAKQSIQMQSVDKCSYSATSKSLLKLNTPYKKQNLKSKWSDDCLEVDCSIASPSYRPKSMKIEGSSTWTSDQKLADLADKPVTIVGLSFGPAIIGANLPSSPMTVQEFNIYLKQNTGSVLMPRPVRYADCEEILSKNARDFGNNVSCSEQLTEETNNHIQQDEEHGYVKIIAGAIVKTQNEEEQVQVDLSEIICAQPSPTELCDALQERIIIASQDPYDGNDLSVSAEELHCAYYETLNESYTSRTHVVKKECRNTFQSQYSNQTKPDNTLRKSKAKFSKQDCQRPRTFKHKEEDENSELCSQSILFVSPTEELQNTVIMICGSDTDQKEKSYPYSHCDRPESPRSTRETSHSRRHGERSSRSSTPHSPGCQQDFSQEDSPFTTNEDYEDCYQSESPLLSHPVH
uniref:uncharacterized protein isoform X2 n=1 Tax=Pristiophorus japonicus TaxID=55135 RepID=UPI00398F07A5